MHESSTSSEQRQGQPWTGIRMLHTYSGPGEAGGHGTGICGSLPVSANRAPGQARGHPESPSISSLLPRYPSPKSTHSFRLPGMEVACGPFWQLWGSRLQIERGPVKRVRVTTTPLACVAVIWIPLTAAWHQPTGVRVTTPRSQEAWALELQEITFAGPWLDWYARPCKAHAISTPRRHEPQDSM